MRKFIITSYTRVQKNRDFFYLFEIIIIQKPRVIEEKISRHIKGLQMNFKMMCHMTTF